MSSEKSVDCRVVYWMHFVELAAEALEHLNKPVFYFIYPCAHTNTTWIRRVCRARMHTQSMPACACVHCVYIDTPARFPHWYSNTESSSAAATAQRGTAGMPYTHPKCSVPRCLTVIKTCRKCSCNGKNIASLKCLGMRYMFTYIAASRMTNSLSLTHTHTILWGLHKWLHRVFVMANKSTAQRVDMLVRYAASHA